MDSLVMGMMENNKIEGTVPFVKVQVDTVVSYRYDITGLQPLNEYFSGIVSKNKILTVIEEILNERTLLEEYMLDIMYEIPKDDSIGQVIITREYIEGTGGPRILLRGQEIPLLSVQ